MRSPTGASSLSVTLQASTGRTQRLLCVRCGRETFARRSPDASLLELRPADARVVAQLATPEGPPFVGIGMLIAAFIGISWFAFRRRFS